MSYKKMFYIVPSGMLMLFLVFFTFSHRNYVEVVETNEELVQLLDEQRENDETIIQKWSNDYSSLRDQYAVSLRIIDELHYQLDTAELPVYTYTEAEIELLACCVQCEAGVDNEESQKDITSVILNRVRSGSFADSIEMVIYEKVNGVPQFAVAYDGAMEECVISPKVLANVYSVIVLGNDLPEDVLYFYSDSLEENNWIRSLEIYDIVEGTVFAYGKENE